MMSLLSAPHPISRAGLLVVAGLAIAGLAAVETFRIPTQAPDYDQRVRAARLASAAGRTVAIEREGRGFPINREEDPNASGLVGTLTSPITAGSASIQTVRRAADPNVAAMIYTMLVDAGVKQGDPVAVNVTGSYPGANIATYAALAVLEADPVIITTPVSSEWGANLVGYGWPDMEAVLVDRGHFTFRAQAGSLAGLEGRGESMARVGRSMIRTMLERYDVPVVQADDVAQEVRSRLDVYDRWAAERRPVLYVNLGAEHPIIGGASDKLGLRPGLNTISTVSTIPPAETSVPATFLRRGIPVLHLVDLDLLASQAGIHPVEDGTTYEIGAGPVYISSERSLGLMFLVFGGVVGTLILVTASERRGWPAPPDPALEPDEGSVRAGTTS
jgi:poly-gamma-glutamate system protein